MSWHKKARSLAILVKDLKLIPIIQPRGSLPYSHNASASIWVGMEFPYKKAISMILWSRNYYTDLHYLALSDYVSPYTSRYDKDLFIGGSTRKALKLDLAPWTPKDFKKLKRIKSLKKFHALIRSHYPKSRQKKLKNLL